MPGEAGRCSREHPCVRRLQPIHFELRGAITAIPLGIAVALLGVSWVLVAPHAARVG
jgi:hypothetical protein